MASHSASSDGFSQEPIGADDALAPGGGVAGTNGMDGPSVTGTAASPEAGGDELEVGAALEAGVGLVGAVTT